MNRLKFNPIHFTVALVFALLAGGVTAWISFNQDHLIEWTWQKTDGAFQPGLDPILFDKLKEQVDQKFKSSGQVCQVRWAGQDRSSAFFAFGCATFSNQGGEIFADGDTNFVPARARLNKGQVVSVQKANLSALENSMKRIFPREVAHATRLLMDRDTYLGDGMKLQMENAASP